MIVFFLVFAVGFAASRLKVIKEDALPAFAQIITKILLPCMIFYSTYANCKRETIIGNWEMVLLAALFYAVISLLIFVMAEVPIFEPLQLGLSTVSSATTGMCMLYLGALASFSRVLPVLKRPELYVGIVVKMIVLPVVAGHLIAMTGIFPRANGARACHHHGATRHDSGAHGGCQQRQGVRICDRHYCCNARGEHRNHSVRCVPNRAIGQVRYCQSKRDVQVAEDLRLRSSRLTQLQLWLYWRIPNGLSRMPSLILPRLCSVTFPDSSEVRRCQSYLALRPKMLQVERRRAMAALLRQAISD